MALIDSCDINSHLLTDAVTPGKEPAEMFSFRVLKLMNASPARVWNEQPKTSVTQILMQPWWGGTEQRGAERAEGWWIAGASWFLSSLVKSPVRSTANVPPLRRWVFIGPFFTFSLNHYNQIELFLCQIFLFFLSVSQFWKLFIKRNGEPTVLIMPRVFFYLPLRELHRGKYRSLHLTP